MMGCCGFDCNECPAYVDNVRSRADQERVAEAWGFYFGITVPAEMARCRGCRSADREGWDFPDRLCGIRQCVMERGLDTCGDCAEYPCAAWNRRCAGLEAVLAHWRPFLTPHEYDRFLRPYDARAHLLDSGVE